MSKQLFWLIDANNLICRYYHTPSKPLSCICSQCRGKGCEECDGTGREQTKAVYLFTKFLLKLLRNEKPDYLAVIFDGPRHKLNRKKLYPQYKANRPPTDHLRNQQIARCQQIVKALGLQCMNCTGHEADDAIATLARTNASPTLGVRVVSGDKDLLACVSSPFVRIYDPLTGNLLGRQWCKAKFGVEPEQLTDYLAMVGDASDNIPGLPGVGAKTAAKLLTQYGKAKNIPVSKLPKACRALEPTKLHGSMALSKSLVTFENLAGMLFPLEIFKCVRPEYKALAVIFRALEFESLQSWLADGSK